LRAAIQEANALAGADTITVPTGTYTLTITGTGEDDAATGDLDITSDVTITGAGATTTIIDGGAIDRVLHILNSVTVAISGVTIQNGFTAGDYGAGIYNEAGLLTLTNVIVTNNNNPNGNGAGIENIWSGFQSFLTLNNVVVSNNTALSGGIGGGIENDGGTINATNLTVSGNRASSTGGLGQFGTATLTNVTVYGNSATGNYGGINEFGVTDNLINVTIANNSAGSGVGGIRISSSVTARNVIIANNTGGTGNCGGGTLISNGHNISSDSSCSSSFTDPTDLNSTDPLLGTFGPVNGSLLSVAPLLTGSPAIDAGTCAGAPTTDEIGTARPQGSTCDIGAYEYVSAPAPAPSPGSSSNSITSNLPSCTQFVPLSAPNLYQIATTRNTATLYFSPAGNPVSRYAIVYGYWQGDGRWAVIFDQGASSGAINYTVNYLDANQTYFFHIFPLNGCQPGPWSNWKSAKTSK